MSDDFDVHTHKRMAST